MRARDVPFEVRKMTRLQLQEALLKSRYESREARSEMGEAKRSEERAHGAVAVLTSALEAIVQIADCRTQHARDEWRLVADIAVDAVRKATP